jgi:hypothetical protein
MLLGDETKDVREPISPELVLIDAELAATARAQLPDFAVRYPSPAPPRVEEAGEVPALVETPEPPPSAPLTWADDDEVELDAWERKAPSWRFRAGVAATVAALFALSAFLVLSWRGSALDPRAAVRQGAGPSSPGREVPPPVPATSTPGTTLPGETSPGGSGTTQPTQTETAEQPPKAPPPPPPPLRPPPPPTPTGRPPSNVLGVVVTAGSRRVTLQWQRPANAVAVIILRRPGRHGAESTVYEGTSNKYVDRTVRNRIAYRYLIISRDRQGRLSSGVPTVVTPSKRS